jgi:carbonic anhydrase
MDLPKRLIEGYECFRSGRLPREQSRYHDLAENGQSPETMLIGCCDSRVSPDVIFDARPGELFVVRNVANLVPPFSPDDAYHGVSAALEFAVQVLRVKHIVVLGHAQCGGIKAFAERNEPLSPSNFIGKWMSMIAPAAAAIGPPSDSPETYLTRLEQAAMATTLENLMTFPYIRSQVERGALTLHAAYFAVASGDLAVRDPATGSFRPWVREPQPKA